MRNFTTRMCHKVTHTEYVRGDTIRITDANVINAVHGANSAIALASSMNDPSIALITFNQRDLTFVEVKLM